MAGNSPHSSSDTHPDTHPDTLEGLQAPEHRQLLDTIDQLRNLGLDRQLSLPQLVVCGDQSAGKSSVLEALTEISFPRADNLCTRFATEIVMRRAPFDKITVRIIPDESSPAAVKEVLKNFNDSIEDYENLTDKLAGVIDRAKAAMGINDTDPDKPIKRFSSDRLSIEIQGPSRVHLTLVDLPGLIQNEEQPGDRALVDQLTKSYISQHRTICLCILNASNDADNQRILTLVKEFDQPGNRSLGIITKPDTLPAGSGSERAFIELAKNNHKRYFFKLGWHVLKNRSFAESAVSFGERNRLEEQWFKKSNFQQLPRQSLGIDALRDRLSNILLEHIKQELPAIRSEVERRYEEQEQKLKAMGESRFNADECRDYLIKISEKVRQMTELASNGIYQGQFFHKRQFSAFQIDDPETLHRLRAAIQHFNAGYSDEMLCDGHKYNILPETHSLSATTPGIEPVENCYSTLAKEADEPIDITTELALQWVENMIIQNRGRELMGTYNPLVVSGLFWVQSERWEKIAKGHIDEIYSICETFLKDIISYHIAPDVFQKVWTILIASAMKERVQAAYKALEELMSDVRDHPINYDHYYTDTKQKIRGDRREIEVDEILARCTQERRLISHGNNAETILQVDRLKLKSLLTVQIERNIKRLACHEALDDMRSIYKVQLKSFIHGIVSRVIEGNLVRGLEHIFSPNAIGRLDDEAILRLVSEPRGTAQERQRIKEQLELLKRGIEILS